MENHAIVQAMPSGCATFVRSASANVVCRMPKLPVSDAMRVHDRSPVSTVVDSCREQCAAEIDAQIETKLLHGSEEAVAMVVGIHGRKIVGARVEIEIRADGLGGRDGRRLEILQGDD